MKEPPRIGNMSKALLQRLESRFRSRSGTKRLAGAGRGNGVALSSRSDGRKVAGGFNPRNAKRTSSFFVLRFLFRGLKPTATCSLSLRDKKPESMERRRPSRRRPELHRHGHPLETHPRRHPQRRQLQFHHPADGDRPPRRRCLTPRHPRRDSQETRRKLPAKAGTTNVKKPARSIAFRRNSCAKDARVKIPPAAPSKH